MNCDTCVTDPACRDCRQCQYCCTCRNGDKPKTRLSAKLKRHPEAWITIVREAYRRAFCRPIEELYAEIRAEGKDPEQVAQDFKNLFLQAIDNMRKEENHG